MVAKHCEFPSMPQNCTLKNVAYILPPKEKERNRKESLSQVVRVSTTVHISMHAHIHTSTETWGKEAIMM